jgi:hypothetical protein
MSEYGPVARSVIKLDHLRPSSHPNLITLRNCHFLQT